MQRTEEKNTFPTSDPSFSRKSGKTSFS